MKKNILAKLSPFHFLMLLIAGIINAIGVTLFIAPVQLYDSGISGTSILLSQLTPDYLSLSFFLILLNIPLLLFGFKRQGAVFSIYAIFTVCVYSVAAWLITDVLPIDVSIASPLAGTDLFLCALFGGIISGVGSGLAIRYGGAMDGIEVVAVIFAKPLGLSVGTFVLIYNVLLYIICGIVMGSWILPLYSIVTYAAGSKTVDFIVDGLDSAKAAMIITTHPDEVARAVSEEFGTGLTIIDAHGFYSDTPKTVLYVVVNRFQTVKLKTLVKGIDAAQIVMLPGGFSAGDEPDGSGKFIATALRNPRIMEAIMNLLNQRDGLMLGICNGFQALIKLGLVPYGEIRTIREDDPTLTYNTIGRHAATHVRTVVSSVKSPWMAGVNVGDVHQVAISHGEGRFVCREAQLKQLVANGQIVTQYCTIDGVPAVKMPENPNGSYWAVEGICSPDGRVLGKMGHSERIGANVARNIPGEKDQKIFESGVAYFG